MARKTSAPTVAPARGTGIIQQPAALRNLDGGRKYNGWTERKTSVPTEAVARATGVIQKRIFGGAIPSHQTNVLPRPRVLKSLKTWLS